MAYYTPGQSSRTKIDGTVVIHTDRGPYPWDVTSLTLASRESKSVCTLWMFPWAHAFMIGEFSGTNLAGSRPILGNDQVEKRNVNSTT